jgi:hypothetical protein
MGWTTPIPGHEGYPVALVPVDDDGAGYVRFMEADRPEVALLLPRDTERELHQRVRVFQVGCDCGWRSRRFYAPLTAYYSPHSLELGDDQAEEEARVIWLRHVNDDAFHDGQLVLHLARLQPHR